MIEVKNGVFWNLDAENQSGEVMEWLASDVRPNLGETDYDEFARPHMRVWEDERFVVVETQVYINESHSWARSGVKYSLKVK